MSGNPIRGIISFTLAVLLVPLVGCGEHVLAPEQLASSERPPVDAPLIDVLPLQEGHEWHFDLFGRSGTYPVLLDSSTAYLTIRTTGTIIVRFLEIEPGQDSTQTISIEKQSTYWEISEWSDGSLVLKRDSTFRDTTETFEWLVSNEEIRMFAKPYSLPIPRFARPRKDTLVFEEPCFRCSERLVVTPKSGILEYYHYWIHTTLDGPDSVESWTRR